MTTLQEITKISCATRLCALANGPARPDLPVLFCFRVGAFIKIISDDFQSQLQIDAFRTYLTYRLIWGYAGDPKFLFDALENPNQFEMQRLGIWILFTIEECQKSSQPFYLRYLNP